MNKKTSIHQMDDLPDNRQLPAPRQRNDGLVSFVPDRLAGTDGLESYSGARLDLEIPIVRRDGVGQSARMKPVDIQQIGNDVAIKWTDGSESYISLERLRRACPCAGCKGEMDVMGNLYKGPDIELKPESFVLRSLIQVGTYAVQPTWGDGHNSGIYSFEYLRRVADEG